MQQQQGDVQSVRHIRTGSIPLGRHFFRCTFLCRASSNNKPIGSANLGCPLIWWVPSLLFVRAAHHPRHLLTHKIYLLLPLIPACARQLSFLRAGKMLPLQMAQQQQQPYTLGDSGLPLTAQFLTICRKNSKNGATKSGSKGNNNEWLPSFLPQFCGFCRLRKPRKGQNANNGMAAGATDFRRGNAGTLETNSA